MTIKKTLFMYIPLIISIILVIMLVILQNMYSLHLRSVPNFLLTLFVIISIFSALIASVLLCKKYLESKSKKLLKALLYIVTILAFAFVGIFGFYFLLFSTSDEEIKEINGVKVLVVRDTFLADVENYYEYVNDIFYGEHL